MEINREDRVVRISLVHYNTVQKISDIVEMEKEVLVQVANVNKVNQRKCMSSKLWSNSEFILSDTFMRSYYCV